ncbi:MAG TPA: PfkB family carbohydrate kinase [Dehalococcoidia bacterium]|nr:PfkB family carbohydrate kinase [Dehalococcoidia bacterium]
MPACAPQFLVIGHITRDRVAGKERPGGTAGYAAAVAARLGVPTAVLTSAAADLELPAELAGVQIERLPAAQTTVMEHVWHGRDREQFVRARAAALGPESVPAALRDVPVVLFGAVTGEVAAALPGAFPRALRGATLQGWLRRIGADERVEAVALHESEIERVLADLDAAFLSEEDLGAPFAALRPLLDGWARRLRVLAVTRGDLGSLIAVDGAWHEIGVFPASEVEGTGAGDAFAAAFLIRYHELAAGAEAQFAAIAEAARFAAATASFVVEAYGVAGAPSRAQIEARLAACPDVRLRPL